MACFQHLTGQYRDLEQVSEAANRALDSRPGDLALNDADQPK